MCSKATFSRFDTAMYMYSAILCATNTYLFYFDEYRHHQNWLAIHLKHFILVI